MARRCGIDSCFQLAVEEILMRLKVCINWCDYFRKNGKHYRRKHLTKCLARTRDREDSEWEWEILEIIQKDKDRSFWCRLNYVMGKACSGSVRKVLNENEESGTLMEHVTHESVQQAIFDNTHRKQFFLAEAALS
jgi:hypothetical protein